MTSTNIIIYFFIKNNIYRIKFNRLLIMIKYYRSLWIIYRNYVDTTQIQTLISRNESYKKRLEDKSDWHFITIKSYKNQEYLLKNQLPLIEESFIFKIRYRNIHFHHYLFCARVKIKGKNYRSNWRLLSWFCINKLPNYYYLWLNGRTRTATFKDAILYHNNCEQWFK